jgi:hypothetical protein
MGTQCPVHGSLLEYIVHAFCLDKKEKAGTRRRGKDKKRR